MKSKRSMLSLVIFSIFLFTSISPVAVFASPTNVNWQDPLTRMKQIQVIDSSVTNGNAVFTRGQFAKSIVEISGSNDLASTMVGSTIYPDINASSALSGYVNELSNVNLMYGMADGSFHPEQNITYGDACTILVKLLGYTDADLTGTWPNNYINKAKNLKITNNITLNKNDNLPVWAAAIMFDNLLGTNIKMTATSTANETYLKYVNLYEDYTILGTPSSSDDVANGSVLTDQGVLYTNDDSSSLQVGNTYRLGVTNGDIDTVYGQISDTQSITVTSATGDTVYYTGDSGASNMTLPSGVVYYYKGVQQTYANINSLLKVDTTIVFKYNTTKTGYSSAVIVDPIYSNPEIALNFDPTSNTLGAITFDANTPIIKNGQTATKNDIDDMDAVYTVTDVNGENRKIQIFENNIQGNITEFITNASSATGIQIDNTSYNYSSTMDLSNISSFNIGDLVEAIEGQDGSIIALRSISEKTGSLVGGVTILGNSKTSDNLTDNQVLAVTDANSTATVYNCLSGAQDLSIGAKYNLYIDGTNITKVQKVDNLVENYSVTSVLNSNISVTDISDANQSKVITLPQASAYYYHGQKEPDYATALNAVQPYSSIILAKDTNGDGYSYAVIVDPYFSDPQTYLDDRNNIITEISGDTGVLIYRNGQYGVSLDSLNEDDVVYFVSDIWNTNKYIYVNENTVYGSITSFSPNKLDPTSITIGGVSYEFSQYFNYSQLKTTYANLATNDYIKLILGYDGKVVEIDN